MSNIVSINLLGKTRTFKTSQKSETLQAVADIVNEKIYALAKKHNAEPTEAFGMMAALDIASELYQLRLDYKRLLSLAENE